MVVLSILVPATVLLACLAAAAFFSLAETALIGVPRHQVRVRAEQGHRAAMLLNRMMDEPERILSTVLVGNNLVNIGATAFATVVALSLFGAEGALIAAAVMAVLITVATEIIPKTFAVQRPLPIALAVARPLRLVEAVLKPAVLFLAGLSRGVARLAGSRQVTNAPFITQDEIEMIVREGVREGEVDRFTHQVLKELFDFGDTDLRKVMTPRDAIQFLLSTAPLRQAAELAHQAGRTRLLVVEGDLDHVVGCVHVKDLLRLSARGMADVPVAQALRPVLLSRSELRPDELLVEMQKSHRLMAVIQDGRGATLGLVTLEDLLEELLGEIEDETRPHGPQGVLPQRGSAPRI